MRQFNEHLRSNLKDKDEVAVTEMTTTLGTNMVNSLYKISTICFEIYTIKLLPMLLSLVISAEYGKSMTRKLSSTTEQLLGHRKEAHPLVAAKGRASISPPRPR